MIGIQVLNPITPESTEQLVIYDYQEIIESEVSEYSAGVQVIHRGLPANIEQLTRWSSQQVY